MGAVIVWVLVFYPGVYLAARDHEVSGTVGESLTVHCTYPKNLRGYKHYWCKGAHQTSCSIVVQSKGSENKVRSGRFSVEDKHRNCIFTVTMIDLTLGDSGLYWCGTERPGPDFIFQVRVTISLSHHALDFNKPKMKPTMNLGLQAVSSFSPITMRDQPSITANELNSTANIIVSSLDLMWTPPEERNSTKAHTRPSDSYMMLQWQVKAALISVLMLGHVVAWMISRNGKKYLMEEDV
ncbi:CMRF35-like molecule 3 [Pleurodeles waltl]|uniref:CMRF35-like molecule 3 n=1 Tax=Pleurodeles waltl TaxID=8319 RepID=UPI00370944C1